MRMPCAQRTQLGVLVTISVVVTALVAFLLAGCGRTATTRTSGDGRALSGALPTLRAGDTWTEKDTSEGESTTCVSSVTGHAKVGTADVYLLHGSFKPAMFGVFSTADGMMDVRTGQMVEERTRGTNVSVDVTSTFRSSGSPVYPLRVGNVSYVTETDRVVRTVNGVTQTATETHNYVYRVEKIESVSVPAGTFACFKQVRYESGRVKEIAWVSPDVKLYDVKDIDDDTPMMSELLSYSLK